MMKSHSELKFFKATVYLLFYVFILDSNNFEHFLKMKNKILKVTISFDYFINGESNC